jgi:hypothetical protein
MARKKQRTVDSNGRTGDGRFAKGNRCGFKPGQSGNPKGRPGKLAENVELLQRLTEGERDGYGAAGRLLAGHWRRNPEGRIEVMEALRILCDELMES